MNKSKPRQIITRHTYLRKCPAGHGETGLEQTHSSVNCEIPQSKANIKDVSYPVGLLGGARLRFIRTLNYQIINCNS